MLRFDFNHSKYKALKLTWSKFLDNFFLKRKQDYWELFWVNGVITAQESHIENAHGIILSLGQ